MKMQGKVALVSGAALGLQACGPSIGSAIIANGHPPKRVCSVDEIANVAPFLASDDSSYSNEF